MIGTSRLELLFIRVCIFFLHWITPLSILLCAILLITRPILSPLPLAIAGWASAEAAFYALIYLPRRHSLQKAALHPERVPREDRRRLFQRCAASIPDPDYYLTRWFMDTPISKIKRENLKEFLRWAFLSTKDANEEDEEEVEEYAKGTEELLEMTLEAGRSKAKCLRLTFDKVNMLHRSLLWYLFFSVFPFRPHNVLARKTSPSKTLTYWHRSHTAKDRLPILFIHGIGIGLYPYVDFLNEINSTDEQLNASDETVGIIALEIMPVSFRITGQPLQKREMCAEINKILEAHGWDEVVLVSHSYGSVVSTHLLHTPEVASKIGPIVLIDPVTFLLHLPDVAYNFLYRRPQHANEYQLDYFASKDMGVAHTLSRHFFWSENIVWKEDFGDRPVTVVLSGRDLIVNTEHVGAYLTDADATSREMGTWKSQKWVGDGLDILWFEDLDHAQVFDAVRNRARVLDVMRSYCSRRAW